MNRGILLRTMNYGSWSILLLSGLLSTICSARAATPPCSLMYTTDNFAVKDKPVMVEIVRPNGVNPAVLFIHGSGGLLRRSKDRHILPEEENFGEYDLACRGYVVALVHYFDASDMYNVSDIHAIHENSGLWIATLQRAVSFVMNLPGVDSKKKIGLLGESLGGYLALALGNTDSRIGAISEISSGIPDDFFDHPERLPPVLIQHGKEDTVVSVNEAYRLQRLLENNHVVNKLYVYDGFHHVFPAKGQTVALERSGEFFDEYLRH
jgi:dipeptidyl aminopeptidase/acylaminoacyl peptidase